jgi:preprotein translocase subunit SecE
MGVKISQWDNGNSTDPQGSDRIPTHRDPTNAVTTWVRVYTWIKGQLDLVYSTLGLGETSTTAYRGDRGKTAYDHSQATHAPSDSVSLSTVKADTDIADAISKKHATATAGSGIGVSGQEISNTDKGSTAVSSHLSAFTHSNIHAPESDNQDLSGLVVKEAGKSLVADLEIAKIHALNADAETAATIATIINGVGADTLDDADTFPWYKNTGGLLKKITWANIKSVFALSGHNHSGTYQPAGSYEVTTNKETSVLDTSVTKYPNNAVVKSAVDGKVDKVTGSSLVADAEISKIHASGSDAETISTVGTILNGATADTILDADTMNFWDAVDSILKKITWANIIVTIRTALFSTTSGILKANGSGVISAAAAGDMPESASYRTVTDTEKGTWNGKQAALTFGIADTNKVQIDSADVADNEYARFTATGLEGRTPEEVLSDIGAATLHRQKLMIVNSFLNY